MSNIVQVTNTNAEVAKIRLVAWKVCINATEVGFITADGIKFAGNQEFKNLTVSIFGQSAIKKFTLGGTPTIECDLLSFNLDSLQLIYNYSRNVPNAAGSNLKLNTKAGCSVLPLPWAFYPIYCDDTGTNFEMDANNPFVIQFPRGAIKDDIEIESKNDEVFSTPLNLEGLVDVTTGESCFIGNRANPDYMALMTKVLTGGVAYTSIPTIAAVSGATFVANVNLATGKLVDIGISNRGTSTSVIGWQTVTITGGGATTPATGQVFFG